MVSGTTSVLNLGRWAQLRQNVLFNLANSIYSYVANLRMADSPPRIVFFHPDLGIGGAERLVIDAAVGLKSRGYKVTIYTSHRDVNHCFDEARDGMLSSGPRPSDAGPVPTRSRSRGIEIDSINWNGLADVRQLQAPSTSVSAAT